MQVFVHTSNTQKSRSRDSIDRIGIQIDFTEFYDRTSVYISNRCQTSFSCNCCPVSGHRTTDYRSISLTHRIQRIARLDHEMLSLLQCLHERSIKPKYIAQRSRASQLCNINNFKLARRNIHTDKN